MFLNQKLRMIMPVFESLICVRLPPVKKGRIIGLNRMWYWKYSTEYFCSNLVEDIFETGYVQIRQFSLFNFSSIEWALRISETNETKVGD